MGAVVAVHIYLELVEQRPRDRIHLVTCGGHAVGVAETQIAELLRARHSASRSSSRSFLAKTSRTFAFEIHRKTPQGHIDGQGCLAKLGGRRRDITDATIRGSVARGAGPSAHVGAVVATFARIYLELAGEAQRVGSSSRSFLAKTSRTFAFEVTSVVPPSSAEDGATSQGPSANVGTVAVHIYLEPSNVRPELCVRGTARRAAFSSRFAPATRGAQKQQESR